MNSAVSSVLLIMGNSLKAEHLMIGAGAFLVVTYSLFCLRRRNLPPLAKEGILDTVKILTAGKANPKFYLSKMKELGPVYRIRMPEMRHWVVVSDSALARKLMSEEDEKPFSIQRFNGVTNGINSVFTHRTSSHDWHSARRGATSSFSIANVNLALPWINRKTDELKKMLMDHHSAKTTFDLPKLMSHLTKDLICGGISMLWMVAF
jgi:cytochrome P450